MSSSENNTGRSFSRWVERVGHKIPDPVIIFMAFYPIAFLATVLLGGHAFETMGAGGEPRDLRLRAVRSGDREEREARRSAG